MLPMKRLKRDSLNIKIYNSRTEAGNSAAEDGAAAIRILLEKKDYINVVFAAAPSQNDTLHELTKQENIGWNRICAFHMDEYVGLDTEHRQSFGYYLNKHIFGILPFKEIHYLNGAAADCEEECARYASLISEYTADIVFLGIGENGHLAFNDPGVADFSDSSLVKIVELDSVCRMQQVHDGCFSKTSDVPTHALTLTIPALISAEYLFCTVPCAGKADAVYRTAYSPINESCPSTIMRSHRRAVMYCDSESGKKLL